MFRPYMCTIQKSSLIQNISNTMEDKDFPTVYTKNCAMCTTVTEMTHP